LITGIMNPKPKPEFDIVLENPPYDSPKNLTKEGGKKAGQRGGDIWPDMVKSAIRFLKEDGFLAEIHPPAWRKPTRTDYDDDDGQGQGLDELHNILFGPNVDMRYLEMHDMDDGRETFDAGTQ